MKNKFVIILNTIDRVKKCVTICESYKEDIDISSGRYVIDGKSIMAILSFDLMKPLNIEIHTDDQEIIKSFNRDMEEFKYEY